MRSDKFWWRVTAKEPVRAFTLIELMVSLAVTLIVTASVLQVYVIASQQAAAASHQASLERDAQRLMDWIERDLSYFGNGVPRGCYKGNETDGTETSGSTCAAASLIPAMRRADNHHLVFVGDLPLPNAELNGAATITYLKDAESGDEDDDEVAFSSDLSGCTPPKTVGVGANLCNTTTATMIDVGSGTNACDQSHRGAQTCPWGLNKWFASTSQPYQFVVGFPSGQWTKRRWDGSDGGDGHLSDISGYYGAHFDHGWPSSSEKDISTGDLWSGSATSAWVAHLDRVFYSLEGSAGDYTLYRRQCWGDIENTNSSDWPSIGSGVMDSGDTPLHCAPTDWGTGWEILQRGIKNLSFRYFTDESTELTGSWSAAKGARLRLVQVDMTLAAKMPSNRSVEVTLSRRFFLTHRGGIVDDSVSLSQGGCLDSGDIHECVWD